MTDLERLELAAKEARRLKMLFEINLAILGLRLGYNTLDGGLTETLRQEMPSV